MGRIFDCFSEEDCAYDIDSECVEFFCKFFQAVACGDDIIDYDDAFADYAGADGDIGVGDDGTSVV